MSKEIDWSKAPEGATHWVGGNKPWHKHIGDTSWYWQESQQKWYQLRICASDVEDEYRETIVKKPEQSWTGQGLPPVGTVCEWAPWSTERRVVEILAYHGDEVWMKYRDHADNTFTVVNPAFFYPIRTPEQIAAEERKRITDDIQRVCVQGENNGVPFHEALYDAGYRKTEAGK